MSSIYLLILMIICVWQTITGIYRSANRLLAVGYAVLGFALPAVLGMAAVFILQSGLDVIGMAISVASPIAAAVAANLTPRRAKRPS